MRATGEWVHNAFLAAVRPCRAAATAVRPSIMLNRTRRLFDSLRLRVFALVLATLVPAIGFGVFNEFRHREALSQDIQRDSEQSAVLLAAEIASQVSGIEQTLAVLARAPDVVQGNADACNRYVENLKFAFNGGSEIGVADRAGKVFCLSRNLTGLNIADRLYFREAVASRKLSVGEFAIGRAAGSKAIHFGYPVQSADGAVSGVAFIPLNLAWLAEHLAKTPLPERSSITVADRNGTVLVRIPEQEWVGQRLPGPWLTMLHASAPGSTTVARADGARFFVGHVPLGSGPPGLFVAVGLAEDVVMASAVSTGNRAMYLTGLSVLLAFALSWVISELLVHKPLLALTRATEELKRGNLSARVPIHGRMVRDLESLGRTFNELAAVLEENEEARRRVQQTMQEARDLAQAASRSKTTFMAALGHDLRQPLHSISMNAALLGARLAGKPDAALARRMQRSIDGLADLVNGVLDVSQLDAGLTVPAIEDFGIDSLLEAITDDFGAAATTKRIALVVVPSTYWVRSDPALLRRIAENLVGNALKYTPSGGRVEVGCESDASQVKFFVADNGPGIPLDQQPLIWEEFWQLGNADRDSTKGLGLGLAIVRRLSGLLGHRVTCESSPGAGSTFTVTLPRAEPKGVATVPFDSPTLRGKVFLVDDGATIVATTAEVLETWGLTVITCASGEEALVRLAEPGDAPEAVITDYRLPGVSGLEVIAAARRRYGSLLCILVTGDVTSKLVQQIPSDVVTLFKPVALPSLAAALKALDRNDGYPAFKRVQSG